MVSISTGTIRASDGFVIPDNSALSVKHLRAPHHARNAACSSDMLVQRTAAAAEKKSSAIGDGTENPSSAAAAASNGSKVDRCSVK